MNEIYAYHVVTDRPMKIGQHIIFDETHHNGVWQRVYDKIQTVNEIYLHPEKYNVEELQHHTRVALRELALEKVRKDFYPEYPSRMSCLYVSESLEEAGKWAELFVTWNRPTYSIVKLKIAGNMFTGDANNCFDASVNEKENLLLAERYWKNLPNLQGQLPIKEILAAGDIEVVEIKKEINRNVI